MTTTTMSDDDDDGLKAAAIHISFSPPFSLPLFVCALANAWRRLIRAGAGASTRTCRACFFCPITLICAPPWTRRGLLNPTRKKEGAGRAKCEAIACVPFLSPSSST